MRIVSRLNQLGSSSQGTPEATTGKNLLSQDILMASCFIYPFPFWMSGAMAKEPGNLRKFGMPNPNRFFVRTLSEKVLVETNPPPISPQGPFAGFWNLTRSWVSLLTIDSRNEEPGKSYRLRRTQAGHTPRPFDRPPRVPNTHLGGIAWSTGRLTGCT